MNQSNWVPDEVPLDRPNVARMYDYFLGGGHNFAIDREAAERFFKLFPDLPLVSRANRGVLRRAVRFLVDQGINQFLDIGSGIPTAGNVHEVAQFFEGLELVEPGLVCIPLWRPESEDDLLFDQPARSNGYAAVGRKP